MLGLETIFKTALPMLKKDMEKKGVKAYILVMENNEPEIFEKKFNPETVLKEMYFEVKRLKMENEILKLELNKITENGK